MKNKKNYKFLLSTLVLISAIFFNINHCQKTNANASFRLNDVFRISSCQAEKIDDNEDYDTPIVCAPNNPDEDMTEEEFLELLRRKQI